jgi:hypothetical protein
VQAAPTAQAAQRAIQVTKLAAQASFIGAVDVIADVANPLYAAAYTNLQGVVDPNEIYRAVVAPPPLDPSTNALLPEDQTVAGSRMYNSAGIVITITQQAPGTPSLGTGGTLGNVIVHVGISPTATNPPSQANLNMYDNEAWALPIVNPSSPLVTAASPPVITNPRQVITDPREALNGSGGVNLTTIDIGNLNLALHNGAMTNTDLATNYNGVVYIYDNSNNSSNHAQSYQTPLSASANLNGILLTNGATTPAFNDQNGNPMGFSVVSNNGVYVQGDYNKTPIVIAGTQYNNPSSIMGDAVTAVSSNWNEAHNAGLTDITTRQAGSSSPTSWTGGTMLNPVNASDPGTLNGMTVNSAILTGNTPTSGNVGSGGAQNLVRMIEDWYSPNFANGGMTLTLNGSLGQIFTSKYFSGAYAPGVQNGLGTNNRVYIQPKTRVFSFASVFKAGYTPASSPSTTGFARGPFFNW